MGQRMRFGRGPRRPHEPTLKPSGGVEMISDPDHSNDEDRFVLLGLSSQLNVLIVVHVYKDGDDIIGIISARKATKNEQKKYKR